ncbi:hypothetical protein IH824_15230 [candidate division KSB1 bacterium]|nr:hypothetical protein [candidate division KSB1 bacterium]
MKLKIIALLTCLFPLQLIAQSNNGWQLIALGGVFTPIDEEIQNIYGDAPLGKIVLSSPLGKQGRLKFGVNSFNRSGDPFYQSPDFNAGNVADLTLTGVSLSLETNPLTSGHPIVRLGAGIEYVFGKERIVEQKSGTGRAVGAHLSLTPEFPISKRVSFFAEASYRFLEITFKRDRDRYKFDLSGANLLVGLGYKFGE